MLLRYPAALKPFEDALRLYQAKDPGQYRNIFDNMRFALEQLLKSILNNGKSFENQKDDLLPWMKAKATNQHIITMFDTLLFKSYRIFQNESVKHNEEFIVEEVEFIIYLTGTFMRLLLQLNDATPVENP